MNGTSGCTLLQDQSNHELVVSEKVKSAAEVGGQLYECYCSQNNSNCKTFYIAGKSGMSVT